METKSSIGSWVAGILSVVSVLISLYAVVQLGNVHKETKLVGSTNGGFLQGEVYYNPYIMVNGIQVGTNGSAIHQYIDGTCNPTFVGSSFAATTTGVFFCSGITGVAAGDLIFADMPAGAAVNTGGTGGGSLSGGFVLESAYSTTTGVIAFGVANFTGAATSSFKQATTSLEFWDTN